jgi:CRP-like cAMP-binding protein
MSTQSPEVDIEFDPVEDKRMREILDQYRQIMSTG